MMMDYLLPFATGTDGVSWMERGDQEASTAVALTSWEIGDAPFFLL